MTILWLTDGYQWGYDIRVQYLKQMLTDWKHIELRCSDYDPVGFVEKVNSIPADLKVALNPRALEFIKPEERHKFVIGLSSIRTLQGWRR